MHTLIAANVHDLIDDITRVVGAQFALWLHIVLFHEIAQRLVILWDHVVLTDHAEYLAIALERWR